MGSDLRIRPELLDGVRPIAVDGAKVARARELTADLLQSLFEERICAIHIPGFFPRSVAARAAKLLRESSRITQWYVPQGRGKVVKSDMAYGIGHPLYRELRTSYFENAASWMRTVRHAFLPHMSPMDRLRAELDELWAPGALIPRNRKGQSYFAGLVRVMSARTALGGLARTEGSIHVDDPKRPALPKVFSTNCYVSVPRSGGTLRIWNVAPGKKTGAHPLYRLIARYAFHEGAQEAIARALPPPLVLNPLPGDLVIFDSARPHAVTGISRGMRINIQTFLWYTGKKAPLHIFS